MLRPRNMLGTRGDNIQSIDCRNIVYGSSSLMYEMPTNSFGSIPLISYCSLWCPQPQNIKGSQAFMNVDKGLIENGHKDIEIFSQGDFGSAACGYIAGTPEWLHWERNRQKAYSHKASVLSLVSLRPHSTPFTDRILQRHLAQRGHQQSLTIHSKEQEVSRTFNVFGNERTSPLYPREGSQHFNFTAAQPFCNFRTSHDKRLLVQPDLISMHVRDLCEQEAGSTNKHDLGSQICSTTVSTQPSNIQGWNSKPFENTSNLSMTKNSSVIGGQRTAAENQRVILESPGVFPAIVSPVKQVHSDVTISPHPISSDPSSDSSFNVQTTHCARLRHCENESSSLYVSAGNHSNHNSSNSVTSETFVSEFCKPSTQDGSDPAFPLKIKGKTDSMGVDRSNEYHKLFRCSQCCYVTDRKNNLKRHIITMHQTSARVLECCGAIFHNKASLRDHVSLFHRGGYRCQICGRNFCRKALLRRHLTVHSGQKDFVCHICGYATSHKSNLERHQRVHAKKASAKESDTIDGEDAMADSKSDSPHDVCVSNLEQLVDTSDEKEDKRLQVDFSNDEEVMQDDSFDNCLQSRDSVQNVLESCRSPFPPESAQNDTTVSCTKELSDSNSCTDDTTTLTESSRYTSILIESAGDTTTLDESTEEFDNISILSDSGGKICPCNTVGERKANFRHFSLPDRLKETHSKDCNIASTPYIIQNSQKTSLIATTTSGPNLQNECAADEIITDKFNFASIFCLSKTKGQADRVFNDPFLQEMRKRSFDFLCEGDTFLDDCSLLAGQQINYMRQGVKRHVPLDQTKFRLCCLPYRCFECDSIFSRQKDLSGHVCSVSLRGILNFPLVAAVQKGCIQTNDRME